MTSLRFPAVTVLALVAPIAAVTVGILSVAAAERRGATPFAGLVPRNSAEAAGLGRAAEVLRFLEDGQDPHAVYPVRPEILSSAILRATTVEAAMWSRQLELIKLLEREGAIDGGVEREALACLAADLEIDDVVAHLAPQGVSGCAPGQALARVVARTSSAGGGQ
jgi:hypothetical protein